MHMLEHVWAVLFIQCTWESPLANPQAAKMKMAAAAQPIEPHGQATMENDFVFVWACITSNTPELQQYSIIINMDLNCIWQ